MIVLKIEKIFIQLNFNLFLVIYFYKTLYLTSNLNLNIRFSIEN